MYSPRRTHGATPPELSNNPFIDHPSNALARFPDINATGDSTGTSGQYTSWLQPSVSNNGDGARYPGSGQQIGYGGGYQTQQPTSYATQAPAFQQQASYGTGYASPPVQASTPGAQFQPSSTFGQQLAGQLNGGYGAVQQQPQYTGYPASSQYGSSYPQPGYGVQQQQQPSQYLAEFDPYAPRTSATPLGSSQTGYKPPHPREYVQQHKQELESWDPYAWKQVLNSFDTLKDAWGTRKQEIETRVRAMGGAGLFGGGGYGGYGGQGQEVVRLEQLAKEAESNFGSVAASTFQMQEVYSGYRQSGDLASKRRVRESINAALTSLPDWPSQAW